MATMAGSVLLKPLAHTAFIGASVLVAICVLASEPLLAACAATVGGIVVCSPTFRKRHGSAPWPALRGGFFVILVLLVATAALADRWFMSYWLYGLPLLAYVAVPRRGAWIAIIAVVAIAMFMVYQASGIAQRHQMIGAFFLTLLLSLMLIFLLELKRRQLAPLRRTDELTNAASQQHLTADLNKEIQRSEREGTTLSVIMLALKTGNDTEPADADLRSILPQIGRYLHSHIRDFDAYYRVADLQFLIILPGITSSEASRQAETLRRGVQQLLTSHQLTMTISIGAAGLNIGDDANSLQRSATGALRRAQQHASNNSQTFNRQNQEPKA
ncbi:GGDEF domain-containing protein [Marinobacter sp. M3C]|jgi:diguanylate cyclase (GGDEF)-like protein|uniref:GGDEF domain-containing protein n=1 Tax=Marinobacter sp. M3C TaxID=2917715 RepID=UPI00200DEDDF|nr:diguanylate cyclase [Marinobacter sp. M3C]MCL1478096.1 GGDEF domain-containing protein [Marinobacter sp.]MCL1482323.1 GGDEF domain-containing protein [Marinobacter sp.]MCL1485367.1 GGDEF domain-containing protein [Marinobacter sp.]UQG61871.1 GGDEF domain-containing protein [Marinobacter sp. M3C]